MRRSARRRSPILTSVLFVAVAAGGALIVRASGRSAQRSSAAGFSGRLRAGRRSGVAPIDQAALDHQEALLDEALEESFPASDPVSIRRIV
jgi:hypothetical protein